MTTTRTSPGLPASASTSEALADWEALFGAVTARLRHIGAAQPAGAAQSGILECAQALDQLHHMLVHEIGPSLQIEQRLATTGATLSLLHAGQADAAVPEKPAPQPQPSQSSQQSVAHDMHAAPPDRHVFRQQINRALAMISSTGRCASR